MKLGFIGVGYIGRHIARNLAKGGHDLTIFDIRKDAAEELLAMGASWADSPQAAAEQSEVVFTSLPRPQDVEEVAIGEGGVLSGATKGSVFFDLSTTDPDTIHRIADVATAKGGRGAGRACERWDRRRRKRYAVRDGRRGQSDL